MHRNVELLIGRLATDPKLRRRFAANPEAVLRELSERGLELSEVELEALATTNPEAFRSLAGALDARLRKAPSTAETAAGDTPRTDPTDPERERTR
jgi:hypothetical protein